MAEWKNLTLFVDESGTFEDDREPWIVGGVLVAEDPVAADALIHARLHERWPAVAEAPSQLHMTDLSKRLGPTEATAFASDLLAAPAFLALVAVSNRRKRQAKSRESNYRQMLSDLIALTSNVLDDSREFDHLHIVVATRTIDRERQSLFDDIHRAINAQEELFARALVSRGLFDRFDSNNVTLHQEVGARSWGLGAADVLCNCAWIAEKDPRSPRAAVLSAPILRSKTVVSTAFAKPRHRRAENLRIEGQLGASLAAWLLSEPTQERSEGLRSVMRSAFDGRAATRGRLAVEGALEVLHRTPGLPETTRAELALELEGEVAAAAPAEVSQLRCSLFSLLHANHAGDKGLAGRAAVRAHEGLRNGSLPPEHWHLVADLALLESEAALNDLNLALAWSHIQRHVKMTEAFGAAWELVHDGESTPFRASGLALRAAMAHIRVGLWGGETAPQEALERLAVLPIRNPQEASRRRSIAASAEEVLGNEGDALRDADQHADTDAWSAYWSVRLRASQGLPLPAPLLRDAERHATSSATAPYLRAALFRESALALLSYDRDAARSFADRSIRQAEAAGERSEVLQLLAASCAVARAAVSQGRWLGGVRSARVAGLAESSGLREGEPVSVASAIAFRFGSIR